MKNILVFGASGDTGKYFVNYFLDHYSGKEYKLIALGTKNISYFSDIGCPARIVKSYFSLSNALQ